MNGRTVDLWRQAGSEFKSGRLAAAEATCRRLLAASPDAAMANWMLSTIALRQGHLRAAEAHAVDAARRLDRAGWRDVILVSQALHAAGESETAHEVLAPLATAELPAAAIAELALRYSQLDDHAQAARLARRLHEQGYSDSHQSDVCGVILGFDGDTRRAMEAFEYSLRVRPGDGQAHWYCAQFGAAGEVAGRIRRLCAALAAIGLSNQDAVFMQYALFQEYDTLGQTDLAWAALDRGAEMRRQALRYDGAQEAALYAKMAEDYPDAASVAPADADESPGGATPVFIVGLPRTGTTLLERLLGAHPDVAPCGELNDFPVQRRWVREGERATVARMDHGLLGRRYLQKTRWRLHGKAWFTDKLPLNAIHCGAILRALPKARIIHLRRNPMDSCFSNLKVLFAGHVQGHSYRQDELAANYLRHQKLMTHWARIAGDRLLEVRYESLVADPRGQLARVTSHLGLATVDLPALAAADSRAITTASTVQVRQPLHGGYVGGWRRYAAWLRPLEALLGPAQHDYQAD